MRRDRGRQPAQVKVRRGVGSRQLPLKRPAPTFLPSFRAVCLVCLHSLPQAPPSGDKGPSAGASRQAVPGRERGRSMPVEMATRKEE